MNDGETVEVQGSGKKPYVLKNTGGVYSCTCPAWRNQSVGIERRTCKHLRQVLGEEFEAARTGAAVTAAQVKAAEPKNAPPLLLAHTWDPSVDPTGMWMSEKLDGVRAWWDGTTFWSRLGNEYLAPKWFTDTLPPGVVLDGELWIGRKQFQKTISVVRRQDRSDDWRDVRFVVFDMPKMEAPYVDRMTAIDALLSNGGDPYAKPIMHVLCRGAAHLKEELARVEALGAEGLMLRQAGSKYEAGRSMTLLKVKSFLDDEAEVIGHSAGKGRHKGRVGALEVRLANGKEFSIGSGLSDKERESPPPIGTTITFRYQELSNDGVPRFPTYVGVRAD